MVRLCPICNRPIGAEEAAGVNRPFCSARCKTIDLGVWLSGGYRIGRPASEEDLDEGMPQEGGEELDGPGGKAKPS
jgi:endogenous inhibitor of DNA gyrase (YacG/DUF329 family)